MLTLGQASCLVLGYRPNNAEEREKAKQHLQKSGLVAAYQRRHDQFRPMAIGVDVIDRNPYTFISYPESPKLSTAYIPNTTLPNSDLGGEDGSQDNEAEDNLADGKNGDDGDAGQHGGESGEEASRQKHSGYKRDHGGVIVPFCKERLLHILCTIATQEDPHNEDCYVEEFVTTKSQYELMESIFPNLRRHCSTNQLQYWITYAGIWGKPADAP